MPYDLDGPFGRFDFISRSGINPGFSPGFSLRLFPGDRLNKRHSLRDQKLALPRPFHRTPRPAIISAKSTRPIKRRFFETRHSLAGAAGGLGDAWSDTVQEPSGGIDVLVLNSECIHR
jgi:hypothetical protein